MTFVRLCLIDTVISRTHLFALEMTTNCMGHNTLGSTHSRVIIRCFNYFTQCVITTTRMDLLDFGNEPTVPQSDAGKIADEIDDLLKNDAKYEPKIENIARSAVQHPDTRVDTEPSESSSSFFSASATQQQLLERQQKLMQKAIVRNN